MASPGPQGSAERRRSLGREWYIWIAEAVARRQIPECRHLRGRGERKGASQCQREAARSALTGGCWDRAEKM